MFTNTISARELQTGYRKVLNKAKETNEPIVVITNNKPVGAIISLNLLKRLDKSSILDQIVAEAKAEYKAGKTKTVKTEAEFQEWFEEIRKDAE